MKKSADRRSLAPVDTAQRYTIAEATCYLRISHASIYKEINARRLRVLRHGKRTFVPGSEIARLSRLDDAVAVPVAPATSAPVEPEIKESTAYRLLDSRIHQALMKDIARQQALWDAIQKFDGELQHLTHLVEKLGENAQYESRREFRVAETSPSQPQFLRLKEVMARVGLRVGTLYRYVAAGAFPSPRKFGRSSFWVTAEVNDWIAKRTAGVPLDLDEASTIAGERQ
jgi:predicted DNA-binding transcriptional regulator AlpA